MSSKCFESHIVKAEALRLGFSACGISRAERVSGVAEGAFTRWLADGCNADMAYMANYTDKRLNPALLMEGTRSVISVALNYYPARMMREDGYQFAWYAYGRDYHDVMKAKLSALAEFISSLYDAADAPAMRTFCDTAPVMERYLAEKSGIGWIGKNTQLIVPGAGSCFFLGEVFVDRDADVYDVPVENRCGECRRCLDACPTGALEAPRRLNANRCLSYLTIENRGDIPAEAAERMGNRIYGCDECQRACPWNRFAGACSTPEFQPSDEFLAMDRAGWESLSEDDYRRLFKGSAVKRAKYAGLMRNIDAAKKK